MQDAHDPYSSLRQRDYRCLLTANVLAAISAEIIHVAVSWELYERTNSYAALGFAGLAQFLPVLLLALPAGQLADRFSRKYLLMIAHGTMMSTAMGLALLSYAEGPIPLIYCCLILAGCSRALGMPARTSLIALVVPREQLANAVAWSSSGWQIANVCGPALGGVLIAWTGSGWHIADIEGDSLLAWLLGATPHPAFTYLCSAVGLGLCVGLVSTIRPRLMDKAPDMQPLQSLLAGLRFVWNSDLMLAAITLDLFAVLLGGATALLPIFARDILEVGPTGLGWLRAAPALGALVTALFIAHRRPFLRPGLALLIAVAGFGIATIGFGLSTNFYLSFGMLALTGAFDNISVVVRGTLMQMLTPDAMRGRVAAVNAVFISSSNELGAFESGMVAEIKWLGPIGSVVLGGIGTLVVVMVAMLYWPRLRSLGPLHALKDDGQAPG